MSGRTQQLLYVVVLAVLLVVLAIAIGHSGDYGSAGPRSDRP
ncbi:hypothetical protein ACFRMN_20125 [Streptomyces sp. NPDC056835]